MILKGDLTELSASTIHFAGPKRKMEIVKYDYIDIGDSHKRDCVTSRYLSNFLTKNIGEKVSIAYLEANMNHSLGNDVITVGTQPKHNVIIGIKDSSGKIIVDKEIIDLKGNQSNKLVGCLRNLIFMIPILAIIIFIWVRNIYTFILILMTIGGAIFYLKKISNKRKELEANTHSELKRA